MSDFNTRDYETGYKDGLRSAEATIAALRAENDKLRAALKMARPFIGWAGYYPTILAEVDAALEGPQDHMAKPLEEK